MEHYGRPQHYERFYSTQHARSLPHEVMVGVWMWSVYSEEKDLYFNGYLLKISENESIIVDPPCDSSAVLDAFEPLPRPVLIFITNRDHVRAVADFKQHFGVPVYAHEADAGSLDGLKADFTSRNGDVLAGGWQVIHLENQKSPGECALYNPESKLLVLGDALIGKPFQRLSMLAEDKYRDKIDAIQGLLPLTRLDVKGVLPCDGDPVLMDAGGMIADALIARGPGEHSIVDDAGANLSP